MFGESSSNTPNSFIIQFLIIVFAYLESSFRIEILRLDTAQSTLTSHTFHKTFTQTLTFICVYIIWTFGSVRHSTTKSYN